MRTINQMNLIAVTAAAVFLGATTGIGQVFAPADALHNKAIAASPRAKEVFPWLTRNATESPRSNVAVAKSKSALDIVNQNRALAASPRMKEQFPELSRPAISRGESIVATLTGINPVTEVKRNSALAASPRMQELYPELTRGAGQSFEVAPLR